MGATAVLPPSRLPRRTAAVADLYSRTPCLSINPSCMASTAAPKKPKRPGSTCPEEPPAKRVRGASPHLAAAGNNKRPCPSSGRDPKCSTLLAAAAAIENRSADSRNHLSESTAAQPKPSTGCSMRELIEKARLAKAAEEAVERSEIERRRSEERRKLEQMVATAEFNDPFIDPADVFMSIQQLWEAREAAADAQARIIATARQREMEALRDKNKNDALNTEEEDHISEEDDYFSEEDDYFSEEDDYFSGDDDDENSKIILRGPGYTGDESFDKYCIFGNEVELKFHQRNQLSSIVEELPRPKIKEYVCTMLNSYVIPGEGKMVLPTHILHGYNYPRTGLAMFSSRAMDEVIAGQYRIQYGDNSRVVIWMNQGIMENFCQALNIASGSLLLIRADKMQDFIGVFVEKIDD
ncbi:hypothetical protein ACQ4PT_017430 [Festuca glaucescens]